MLFGHFEDNFFHPLSGESAKFYESAITAVYKKHFSDTYSFPTRADIVEILYYELENHPERWVESEHSSTDELPDLQRRGTRLKTGETGNAARIKASASYRYLLEKGWLEEEEVGINTYVEMTSHAQIITKTLVEIAEGRSGRFSGTLVSVVSALEAIKYNARDNAVQLKPRIADLHDFRQYIRTVVSNMKGLKKRLFSEKSRHAKLQLFFKEYLKEVFYEDLSVIMTTNNPERIRNDCRRRIMDIRENPNTVEACANGYATNYFHEEMAQAQKHGEPLDGILSRSAEAFHTDLDDIITTLDYIVQLYKKTQEIHSDLNNRTVKAMRYRRSSRSKDDNAIRSAVELLSDNLAAIEDDTIPGPLHIFSRKFGPSRLKEPSQPKKPIKATATPDEPIPPEVLAFRQAQKEHLRRVKPNDLELANFIDRQMRDRASIKGSEFKVTTVDDFIAFEAVGRIARRLSSDPGKISIPKAFSPYTAVLHAGEIGENDYMIFPEFTLERHIKDDK